MNENKDFTWPEENSDLMNTEPTQEAPEETAEEEVVEILAEEIPQEPVEEPASASAAPEQEPGIYRGTGAGRKESPFADSPYVLRSPEPRAEADFSGQGAQAPARKRKKEKHGFLRSFLATVGALAVLAGSCGLTAHLVNRRWEERFLALQNRVTDQVESVQEQVNKLTPQSTGLSVSGTGSRDGLTASQVYAQNVHSVVLIESTIVSEVYGQTATGVASGSGFIISEDGYVVTNFHVIEGASAVNVVTYDGKVFPAEMVGYDSTNDIALLKVEASGLDAVVLGSSDDLIVGDQVVAIGNPLGELTSTLTVGYVSAKERDVSTDGTIINMIQTDAAINSGNSGGPLFNMRGEVVGITTAKYSGASSSGATIEGIGFAIPVDDVVEELQQLKDFGYIKSAYLGVLVQNMDYSVASIYGLPVGAYVVGVEPGFCAEKAGIQEKDIIVAVGEEQIASITDLTRALRDYEPGDRAKLTVYRAGQYLSVLVVLDERPAAVG
jgi:serine protease Do